MERLSGKWPRIVHHIRYNVIHKIFSLSYMRHKATRSDRYVEGKMDPYIPEKLPINLSRLNWETVTAKVSEASAALAYYNGILKSIINPAIFLSPLETKEAVLSSRIEGTITTETRC